MLPSEGNMSKLDPLKQLTDSVDDLVSINSLVNNSNNNDTSNLEEETQDAKVSETACKVSNFDNV